MKKFGQGQITYNENYAQASTGSLENKHKYMKKALGNLQYENFMIYIDEVQFKQSNHIIYMRYEL